VRFSALSSRRREEGFTAEIAKITERREGMGSGNFFAIYALFAVKKASGPTALRKEQGRSKGNGTRGRLEGTKGTATLTISAT
jgi:hypothetical protein